LTEENMLAARRGTAPVEGARPPVSVTWPGGGARRKHLLRLGPITPAAIAVVLLVTGAAAQEVTAPALKAGYIYNFVRFTEWPDDEQAPQPLVMCVLGDPAVGDALERVVKGRTLAGRSMTVSLLARSGSTQACHVLYLSNVLPGRAAQVIAGLNDRPVLTISDLEGFTEAGGMAQFFFERGQLRFSIRNDAVKRARLQISSRLLALAKRYEGG
jgi:hypothetical protein